ncbi:MAG: hypothetical protein V4614_15800 [Pseudomonadota bacterium]
MSASTATTPAPSFVPQLVIPFAACSGDAWLQAMKAMPAGRLKNLGKLLQGMKLMDSSDGEALSLSTPHERVLANALGIAPVDGLIPWAALQAAQAGLASGKAWAFITPCHWTMGREHATMTDPAVLGISAEQSQTLLAAMQPYFATEGITLHYVAPETWLAEGEVFRTLPTASLDRVLGRNVDPWLVPSKALKLLQNEMQMLLYTHPLNDERAMQRQRPVNSFWISGTGALDAQAPTPGPVDVPRTLAQAAFSDDWASYAQAWEQLDSGPIASLLAQQNAGQTVRISLCGERNAQTFETATPSLFGRLAKLLTPSSPLAMLEQL